jgi:DNA-binding response OmpR family regulator
MDPVGPGGFRFRAAGADETGGEPERGRMSRILVIDDESIIGLILRHAFDAKGHETVVARDGRTGLEMAKAEHPDAIVLDLMMPGLNGYDVLSALHDTAELKGIPVLVLTAVTLSSDRERCLSEGADAVLTKPFDPRDVTEAVDALLSHGSIVAGF